MIVLSPEDSVVRITPARGSNKRVHIPGEDGKPICQYRSRRTQLLTHKTYRVSSWSSVAGHFDLCSVCEVLAQEAEDGSS